MKPRGYSILKISRKAEATVLAGHPWVYDSEVFDDDGVTPDGGVVDITNQRGSYIATGFINRHSKIRLRILTRNANERIDRGFWERRLRRAVDYRRRVMGEQFDNCRLIFGESDGFPGLTVDRFGSVLVTQTLSLGTEQHKYDIIGALVDMLGASGEDITGVFERNDVSVRGLEGMEQGKGWMDISGLSCDGSTDVIICENGVKYHVDIENGQKTGFFLDQKFNRQAVGSIAKDLRVLDCFTHTGSFALNCAMGGAASVVAADISEEAIATAQSNAMLNGLEDVVSFRCVNVFDFLPTVKQGEYDMIILDPPAFTKSRGTVDSAIRGYKEINLRAMKALSGGGYLATCSCSHFVTDQLFCDMLRSAASDAGVSLRQIEGRQQAKDHPVMWNVPETSYLKFYIFQKM